MRVLLTHSYFLKFDPKQWKQMQPYAPLGTLYAAAVLRNKGFEVALHDVMFADSAESIRPVLGSFKPDMLVIYDDGFNYLSKMCLTNMRNAAFEMSALAKEIGCGVIVSSSDAADHSDEYLDNGADFIIAGEGEETLGELLAALRDQEPDLKQIAGIVYRLSGGGIMRTLPRKVMHDLDALPLPAWGLVNMEQYRKAWQQQAGYFSINMSTTRGCPFKCNWCAKPIYGNRYNVRSPEHVVNELALLQQQFGLEHVWFCDDIFGLKPGWIQQFSALVTRRGLKFRFKIQSRADLLLKDEQIAPLAAAGCDTVWIGAESGSQEILDAMDKGITVEQIQETTALLKKHGIRVAYFLQFGYLGEKMSDIKKTLEMLRANMPDDIGISVSYPLPGTKFYDKVKEQLQQKANWTDSNDLALMFRNNYNAAFYRSLHKYVHVYFRKLKALSDKEPSIKGVMRIPYYTIREKWERRRINRSK